MDAKQQEPKKILDARQEARRRRRRKRRLMQVGIIASAVLVVVLIIALIVFAGLQKVQGIQVRGETRYSAQQLIDKSGIYVGQKLLDVNKNRAHDMLMSAFPYLSSVKIENSSFHELRITVTETPVIAAVQVDNAWMILGENNHALERLDTQSLPADTLRVTGATLAGKAIGKPLLDDRSLRICQTLIAACRQYGLQEIAVIDIAEKTNISIYLDNGMEVVLGNETNLNFQIRVLVNYLPTVYAEHGEEDAGRLDMSAFSDDDPNNDRARYTEAAELKQEPPAEPTPDDSTTPEGDDPEASGTESSATEE